MREGFYVYRQCIYYGLYDARQVSGRGKISMYKPERIQTDHPFSEDDWADCLYDNHRLLEPEYAALQTMLSKMKGFMELNTDQTVDFSAVEERLGVTFPRELRCIYSAIHSRPEYFAGAEHFLPLDELYVEQGNLVFFKKKRTPVAGFHVESGCLAGYCKKEWSVYNGDICYYQFCVGRMLTLALEGRPSVRKGRCKGSFVTTLNIEKELRGFCNETYQLLSEFNVYGIAVMYSAQGLIAWIRSNGFYADIHAGAFDEAQLDAFGRHLGEVAWK